jgi:hypothetical protein
MRERCVHGLIRHFFDIFPKPLLVIEGIVEAFAPTLDRFETPFRKKRINRPGLLAHALLRVYGHVSTPLLSLIPKGELVLVSNEWLQLDLDLYHQMKTLAERQRDALRADRLDTFMLHSWRRQSIQNAISSARKAQRTMVAPGVQRNGRHHHEITGGIRMIEAIREIDAEIETLISLKRDALFGQMKEIRHGQRALRGYGKAKQDPVSRFLKTKG